MWLFLSYNYFIWLPLHTNIVWSWRASYMYANEPWLPQQQRPPWNTFSAVRSHNVSCEIVVWIACRILTADKLYELFMLYYERQSHFWNEKLSETISFLCIQIIDLVMTRWDVDCTFISRTLTFHRPRSSCHNCESWITFEEPTLRRMGLICATSCIYYFVFHVLTNW